MAKKKLIKKQKAAKVKTFSKYVTVPNVLKKHPCANFFKLSNLYRAMRISLLVYDSSKKVQRHSKAAHDTVTQACLRHMSGFDWLLNK